MSVADSTTLRIERTFDAPPEEVFDAWTDPEVLKRWWAADPRGRTPVADVDLRVGGGYRLTMEDRDGRGAHTVRGEYREVLRPERLVYTWAWEQDDGSSGHESTVTVTFHRDGERTTVVLEHTGLPDADARERHGAGWSGCLENLRRRVLPGQTTSTQ
ncbi:MAG TPA: SRPBCC domain-containing protein [Solirubrobacteraceae bacterium]|nr:SRPBCC domain-containing protein [Solirubrobacteraceae bacterium]